MSALKHELRRQLEELLSETVDSARHREATEFDRQAGPLAGALVLFGAGALGRKTLAGLRKLGVEPLAFSDNNPALWGKEIDGIPVLQPDAAIARFGRTAAFIVTIWRAKATETMTERLRPLLERGCARVLSFAPLFWKHPEHFLPHYSFDLPHKVLQQSGAVLEVFDLWEDDASRAEFLAQIRWRLRLDFDGLPRPVGHEIYFPDDLVGGRPDEIYADCGAYNGDTLASFLRLRGDEFRHYEAFEADPANFAQLKAYVGALPDNTRRKVGVHSLAIGARREKVWFDAAGTEASSVGSGSLEVDCAPLDELMADRPPSWIKMDIEGSEPLALQGARKIIGSRQPVLSVCVYHQQDHVWTLPQLIRTCSDRYRYFLRPHLLESWDLVLYAVPQDRLRRL